MAERSRKSRKEEKSPITAVSMQNYYYFTELPPCVFLLTFVHTGERAHSLQWDPVKGKVLGYLQNHASLSTL